MPWKALWAAVGLVVLAVLATWLLTSSPSEPEEDPTPTDTPSVASSAASSEASRPPSAAPSAAPSGSAGSAGALTVRAPFGWAKASRRDFGCMLERELGYKDPLWSCASSEEPLPNPCQEVEGYYRGPQLSGDLVQKVSPLVEEIELHWEHRQLSQVDLILKPGLEERAILDAFQIPASLHVPMDNVQSVELNECMSGRRCLIIHGFSRGDIDCHDGRRPD